ncbi:MAG TPA: restriction endonuclease [Candidatus Elarobacter sp.]|nr:restriction endonuclease [Candidatus Elarobacter sp.]
MPDITRRRTGELLHTLFDLLHEHPEGLPAGEAIHQLEQRVTLTSHEAGHYSDGTQRFAKIVRFSTIASVKAGWLVKENGTWSLTDAGWQAHLRYRDPEELVRAAVYLYRVWKKGQPPVEATDGVNLEEDRASAAITLEAAEDQARSEIERYLHDMPPYDFQDLVAVLLRAMGYHVGWVAPPGKDGGVDIVAFTDPLGTRPPRIKVQVKRMEGRIPVDGLRSFLAVLGADDVGIFVNAGGFTKDAHDEARTQQGRRITLVDLDRLIELWKEHYPQLTESARQRLPLQPVYFLALDS